MSNQPPAVITMKEAAVRYSCSVDTIRRRAKAKCFEVRRPGSNIQIVVSSADTWYEGTGKLI